MESRAEILLVNRSLIVDNERVLIVQRSPQDRHNARLWEFPGGKLDFGENVQQSLEREVLEETGLVTEPISHMTYVHNEIIQGGVYAGTLYVSLFHAAQRLSGDLRLSDEHTRFSWEIPERAYGRHLTPESSGALDAFRDAGIIS